MNWFLDRMTELRWSAMDYFVAIADAIEATRQEHRLHKRRIG